MCPDSYNLRVRVHVSTRNDTNVDGYIYLENDNIEFLNFDAGTNYRNSISEIINATISNTKFYPLTPSPKKPMPYTIHHINFKASVIHPIGLFPDT